MKKRKLNTSIFLLEMIVVCMFLAISSSLCIKGFVKAHEISVNAEEKGNAVLLAQSLAEEFKNSSEFDGIQEMSVEIGYNKDWVETENDSEEKYTCKLHISDLEESIRIKEMNIGIYNKTGLMYDLTVTKQGE